MGIILEKISSNEKFKEVLKIRKKVFIDEENLFKEMVLDEEDKEAEHFLAYKNGKAVGTISLSIGIPVEFKPKNLDYENQDYGHLRRLAVLPKERGKTIGLGLMVIAYEYAKKRGIKVVWIAILKEHLRNINLYHQFGFKEIGDIEGNKILILDIFSDSVYEKARQQKRRKFINRMKKYWRLVL